jgi:hypothetical protein
MKSWLDRLNLNLYREFILSLDQSLQSGWNHQLLCVNNGVHPSLCSPVTKETVPLRATSYVSYLFSIIFNILTGMEVCAVNAGSLALFNIPCKVCPFIEDCNTTSLCNVMLLGRFAKLQNDC